MDERAPDDALKLADSGHLTIKPMISTRPICDLL